MPSAPSKSKPVNATIQPSDPNESSDAWAAVAIVILASAAMVFWLSGL